MRKVKKWLALLLALAMVLSLIPTAAFAAEEEITPEPPVETVAPDTEDVPGETEDPADTEEPTEEEPPADVQETTAEDDLLLDGENLATDETATEWNDVRDLEWYNANPDADSYTISTAEQLAGLAQLVKNGNTFQGKTIMLGNDIDLGGKNWTPIGGFDAAGVFSGTFDGGGCEIQNLSIDYTGTSNVNVYTALFSKITSDATICDLTLTVDHVSLNNTSEKAEVFAAGLVAFITNSGTDGSIHDVKVILPEGETHQIAATGGSRVRVAGICPNANVAGYRIISCGVEIGNGAGIFARKNTTAGNGNVAGGLLGECAFYVDSCYVINNGTIAVPHAPNGSIFVGVLGAAAGREFYNCYAENNGKVSSVQDDSSTPAGNEMVTAFAYGGKVDQCVVVNNGEVEAEKADSVALFGKGHNGSITNSYGWTATELPAEETGTLGETNGILENASDVATACTNLNYLNWYVKDGKIMLARMADDTDAAIVEYVKAHLNFDAIKGTNEVASEVCWRLELLTQTEHGATITWNSSDPVRISNTGKVTMQEQSGNVTLTATIKKGSAEETLPINVTVSSSEGKDWKYFADTSWYNGTDSTFTINTAEELAGLAEISQSNDFKGKVINLGADIDLGGRNWFPIGHSSNETYAFRGTIDGQNHTISNLTCERTGMDAQRAGLIARVDTGANVQNLKITVKKLEAVVKNGGNGEAAAGAIYGEGVMRQSASICNIYNCTVTILENASLSAQVAPSSTAYHGGAGAVAGISWGGTIRDCFVFVEDGATVSVTVDQGKGHSGGYIGYAKWTNFERCSVNLKGMITTTSNITVATNGQAYTGGFAGTGNAVTITDCYSVVESTGKLIAEKKQTTGTKLLCGVSSFIGFGHNENSNKINTSYTIMRGNMELKDSIVDGIPGLLIGTRENNAVVSNSYAFTTGDYGLWGGKSGETDNFVQATNTRMIAENEVGEQSTYEGFDFANVWYMSATNHYPQIGTELDLSDEEVVASVKNNLSFDTIKANNTDPSAVTTSLSLPKTGLKNSSITWNSSKPEVINTNGRVIRPAEDTAVTLTATIRSGAASALWTIELTVKAGVQVGDEFWNNFWKEYWADPAHDDDVWVTVGDSITCGRNGYTSGEKYYQEHLQARLNGEMGKKVTIVNPAIGGLKIKDMNNSYANWVAPYNPDIVSIYFGMNDRDTNLQSATDDLDELLSKILPEPVNGSAPEGNPGPVVVLISCNPIRGDSAEGIMRQFHDHGKTRAEELTASGYHVQYVDLYDAYKNVEWNVDGNLANRDAYMSDSLHPNAKGHYLSAQTLMKNMGMYSAASEMANIPHDQIGVYQNTPAVTVKYDEAKLNLTGDVFTNALSNSPGFSNVLGSGSYQTMLVLGGAATAGDALDQNSMRSYPWHFGPYVRLEGSKRANTHVIAVADESYDVSWFNNQNNFNDLMTRYNSEANPCKFILYMPEVNALYGDNYSHSSIKITDYKEQLDAFVKKCKAQGIELTLITPFPMQDSVKDGYLKDYVKAIIEVAEANGTSLSNLYRVFTETAKTYPHIMRNWYTEDGMPNYIAHLEAIKTFLKGTCGNISSDSHISKLNYRNTATNGTQYDYAGRVLEVVRSSSSRVDLSALLAEPLYANLAATNPVTLRNASGVTIPSTYDANSKSLTFTTPVSYDDYEIVIKTTATNIIPLKGIKQSGTSTIVINPPTVGGAEVAGAGSVAVCLADGSALTMNSDGSYSVPEGAQIKLTAKPNTGYAFERWELTNSAAVYARAGVDLTQNPLVVPASMASSVTAVFKVIQVVEAGAPMLQQLLVGVPNVGTIVNNRPLLREDLTDDQYNVFDPKLQVYTMYVLPGEDEVNLTAFGMEGDSLSYQIGNGAATTPETFRDGIPVNVHVAVTGDTDVVLTVSNGEKTTAYTVHIVRKTAAPQMVLTLEGVDTNGISTMDLTIKGAQFISGDLSIELDGNVFASFADLNGDVLANDSAAIANVFDVINPNIQVDDYAINDQTMTITLGMTSTPAIFNDEGALVLRFKLKQGAGYADAVTKEGSVVVDNTTGANTMKDFLLNELTYNEAQQEADRLVYVKFVDTYQVSTFVNGRPDYSKVTFTVYDSNSKPVNDQPLPLAQYGRLVYNLPAGEYTVRVSSAGYLTAASAKFVVTDEKLHLDNITMYAGDINGDGKIDAADRTALVNALGGTANDNVDLNDDQKVNALDLGAMLRNIGKVAPRVGA